jgi:hypothetical protein
MANGESILKFAKIYFLQDAEIEGLQTALREIPKLSDIQGG